MRKIVVIILFFISISLTACVQRPFFDIQPAAPRGSVSESLGTLIDDTVLKTDNFIVYFYEGGYLAAQSVVRHLENNFKFLMSLFNRYTIPQTRVLIHPTQDEFDRMHHEFPGARGTAGRGRVSIISPFAYDSDHFYDWIMRIVINEFIHVIQMRHQIGWMRRYLFEGTALFISGYSSLEMQRESRDFVVSGLRANDIPNYYMLTGLVDEFSSSEYFFGKRMIRYIVDNWGWAYVVALHHDQNFQRVLDISNEEFHAQWIQHLTWRYIYLVSIRIVIISTVILILLIVLFFLLQRYFKRFTYLNNDYQVKNL